MDANDFLGYEPDPPYPAKFKVGCQCFFKNKAIVGDIIVGDCSGINTYNHMVCWNSDSYVIVINGKKIKKIKF
jgi:hypothetical protein